MNYGYFDMSSPRESLVCLLHIFAGVLAAYIAYNRNKNEGPVTAVFISVLAFIFGFIYILYWVCAVILQDPKYSDSYGLGSVSDEMLAGYSKMVQNAMD